MNPTTAPTAWARIYMAGVLADAERVCREYCFNEGACVTVTPTNYIYSGGQEHGFVVGFINYPRFPATQADILSRANVLARMLADALHQRSWTVETPDTTTWVTRELPFEREQGKATA